MHIHEYQTKEILRRYGIKVPDFAVISDLDEVEEALKELKISQGVLKVQIHAGGRGKAGGVKIGKSPQQILEAAQALLGMKIINEQTGEEGIIARQLLLSPLIEIKKEYYLGVTIDRDNARVILIASPEGGMDVEEIAAKTPERIKMIPLTRQGTLRSYHLIELAKFMGWNGSVAKQGKETVLALTKAFFDTDASLLEINPLVETTDGDIVALDAKLTIDDNALYRQQQIAAFYDPSQITPYEARARQFDLAYVALDGEIGCMVNGAGLAMATMDIIHYYGGSPANFLDVGGGASQEKVAEGFRIILSDPKVKAILVNIFGGIMNCVTLAGGIIAATSDLQVKVPLIVRMEGTNVEAGRKILQDSGLDITLADTLEDAAIKAVQAAKANMKDER